MITKEYGKFFGVCDLCDDETPRFSSWNDCLAHVHNSGWLTKKDEETGEWENYCPECAQKIRRMSILQDFD